MRFLLTGVIWVIILGGLWFYSSQRQLAQERIAVVSPVTRHVEETYSLRITPTFSIEKDPFALQVDGAEASGLDLRLNGSPLPMQGEAFRRGEPLTLARVEGLVQGENEIFLQASPPLAESNIDHGVRIQLQKSGADVVDRTLWSRNGSQVSGTIHFALMKEGRDDHDH